MDEEKREKMIVAVPLTETERSAFRRRVLASGKKQYFYLRELVIGDLVRENYLPQPQS